MKTLFNRCGWQIAIRESSGLYELIAEKTDETIIKENWLS